MSLIYVTRAMQADIPAIGAIFEQAKAFLKASGSPQWQAGYPNTDTVAQDLANHSAWVLKVNDQVAGYAAAIIVMIQTIKRLMVPGKIIPSHTQPSIV